MLKKLLCCMILFACVLSVLAQQESKEEKAIKESIVQSTKTWCDRDFESWQKWIIQDESLYGMNASPNSWGRDVGWQASSRPSSVI